MNYKIILFLIMLSGASIISAYGQENRICPFGSYLGKDSFGNQACLNSKTNQVVSSPNMPQSTSGSNGTAIGIVVFIIIIVIIASVAKSRSKPSSEAYKDVERKRFSFATTERVKELQKGKCAECERYPTHWEFDHIDTRGDNSIENCKVFVGITIRKNS